MIASSRFRPAVLASTLALAAAVTGCGSGGGGSSSCNTTGAVAYAQVAPIFTRYCTRCHSSTLSGGAPAGVTYDTYAGAARSASAGVSAIEAGSMPFDNPGSVSSADLCELQAWVAQGTQP